MKFFCDVCFPKRLCAVLACIDGKQFHFDHHSDQFAQDTDDVTWLWAVGSWIDRPVVISGDNRILKKRDEMQELMEQDLMFVCMYEGFAELDIYEQSWKFLRAWPLICEQVKKARKQSIFKVAPTCQKVELHCETSKLCK